MNDKEARRLSLELMEIAEAAYLTTIDRDGFPQTRAMFNLRRKEQFPGLSELFDKHQDDFLIYFTTNTSSLKMDQIKKNPAVSVYYCKPNEWRGLMLGGMIEIVTDPDLKKAIWQEGWEMYYPGGVDDPDYTILRVFPMFAKYYHQLNLVRFDLRRKT
ncbi:MAG: pyridoxamine 5'-phosphate oxidase family protein [Candidatus Aminicenantia bacterium]